MFSFKINKKSSSAPGSAVQVQKSLPKQAPKKAFDDEDDRDEDERDFIDGLDGNEIVSKKQKKPEKKELVIPLITKNEWRIDKKKEPNDEGKKDRKKPTEEGEGDRAPDNKEDDKVNDNDEVKDAQGSSEDALKEQAIKELLNEASLGHLADKKSTRSIPLLLQNKIPDGYEEEENMDVSLRPDQATLEDYERIPIDEFGLAMLRGMGWKEDEGIGLRNKKVVDMAIPKLRPKGMGLGAEVAHLNKDVVPKNNSNDNEKEDLTLKIGGYAIINRGSKKGYYGQIESFDEDNNRVILRLAISGKMEAVSKFYIDVVSSKEYKKSSKVINSEKYEEYKNKQDNQGMKHDESSVKTEHREDSRRRRSSSRSSDDKDYRSRSRRHEQFDDEEDEEDDHRGDSKRSGHRHSDRDKRSKKSKKGKREDRDRDRDRDRYENKYDDRERSRNHKYDDDYYKSSSSRNGDKRSDRDRHSKKEDYDRDRKRGHSSRDYRD